MLTILFDGVAYGMLLFVLSCGLSVTLGLMNFINLAHGAFAMAGGYAATLLLNWAGVPFLATLPIAFVVPALFGVALERTLYRRLYGASPLDQVLFTIGLVFMAMPIASYFIGSEPEQIHLPEWLSGSLTLHGVGIGVYRLLIVAICGALAAAIQLLLIETRFGAQLRAAVDDARVARGPRHRRRPHFRHHFRRRRRTSRARRRRSVVSGQVPRDLPHRRRDRRIEGHPRRALWRAPARGARRRRRIVAIYAVSAAYAAPPARRWRRRRRSSRSTSSIFSARPTSC